MRLDQLLRNTPVAAGDLAARDCCDTSLLSTLVNCGSDALLLYDAYALQRLNGPQTRPGKSRASACNTLASAANQKSGVRMAQISARAA